MIPWPNVPVTEYWEVWCGIVGGVMHVERWPSWHCGLGPYFSY